MSTNKKDNKNTLLIDGKVVDKIVIRDKTKNKTILEKRG